MVPAPIALFVYNRPEHTRRTLESLAANDLAAESRLIVFSDGPRAGHEEKVAQVRRIVAECKWCREVQLVESPTNRGLADNIVSGVTETLQHSETIIVLEDDLELSPGFLRYMNEALHVYAGDPQVMSVSGWIPELDADLPETFFLRTASSWGWGTWRRAWTAFQRDPKILVEQVRPREREFNLEGGYDYFVQLRLNATGRLRTWAVLWYASIFLANGLTLHPRRSLVRNIGHDYSGTHCIPDGRYEYENGTATAVHVQRIRVEANGVARAAFRRKLRSPLITRVMDRCRTTVRRLGRRLGLR